MQDDPVFIKPTEAVTTKIKDMTKIEHLFTIDSLKWAPFFKKFVVFYFKQLIRDYLF